MDLSFLADWASILALIVTGFNAYQITNVKRRIVINLTLVPLLDRLRANSSDMNLLLVLSTDRLDEVIGVCEANVRAVRRRLGVRQSRFCKGLLRLMAAYRTQKSDGNAREVYNALQQVLQEIANRVEEIRITGP